MIRKTQAWHPGGEPILAAEQRHQASQSAQVGAAAAGGRGRDSRAAAHATAAPRPQN